MAKLFIILSLLLGTTVVSSSSSLPHKIELRSIYQDPERGTCKPGQACYSQQHACPNVTITHGDQSQSCLYLCCELDRWSLILESPIGTSYSSIELIGRDPLVDLPSQCVNEQYHAGVVDISKAVGINPSLRYTLTYRSCGTIMNNQQIGGAEFENTVQLLEFVLPNGTPPNTDQDSVYYTSLTHIDIKCCRSTYSPPTLCTDCISDTELVHCNEKQFELICATDCTNCDTELFKCILRLKPGESLGTNKVGFYVESCSAEVGAGPPVAPGGPVCVDLVNNSVIANKALEVKLYTKSDPTGNLDLTQYLLESAFIQHENEWDEPKPVKISCTVKFAPKEELNSKKWNDKLSWSAIPPRSLDDSNHNDWVQAGQITLVK